MPVPEEVLTRLAEFWELVSSVMVQEKVVGSGERLALEKSQPKTTAVHISLVPQIFSFAKYCENQIQI